MQNKKEGEYFDMDKKSRGKLISFEGIECSGKGVQTQLLQSYLSGMGRNVHLMHEPGGSKYGEAIRALLKYPDRALGAIYREFAGHSDFPLFKQFAEIHKKGTLDISRSAECELFLYEASRSEYAKALDRLLESGDLVISDRAQDSTTAYQGGGRGLDMDMVEQVNRFAMGNVWPDITFLLDIPVDTMLERMAKESSEKNAFFEQTCDRAFFERARRAYIAIAEDEPERFIIIDGTQAIPAVFARVKACIDELLDIEPEQQ